MSNKNHISEAKAKRRAIIGLGVALTLLCSLSTFASSVASISGTVVDPSGAVVRAAAVAIHNSDNGASQRCDSVADGLYNCSDLTPGRYQLR